MTITIDHRDDEECLSPHHDEAPDRCLLWLISFVTNLVHQLVVEPFSPVPELHFHRVGVCHDEL